jgi:hypothetical protein
VVIAKFVKSRSHEPSVEPQGFLGGDPCGIKISFSAFFHLKVGLLDQFRFIIFFNK